MVNGYEGSYRYGPSRLGKLVVQAVMLVGLAVVIYVAVAIVRALSAFHKYPAYAAAGMTRPHLIMSFLRSPLEAGSAAVATQASADVLTGGGASPSA